MKREKVAKVSGHQVEDKGGLVRTDCELTDRNVRSSHTPQQKNNNKEDGTIRRIT